MNRVKRFVRFSGFFIILLFSINSTFAARYMGSDLAWRQLGQDSFLIKFTIYRDCTSAGMVNNINVDFKCATNGTTIKNLSMTVPGGVDVTPICSRSCSRCDSLTCTFPYGVEKYIYQNIVSLNAAGSCCNIRLSTSLGSRSVNITTGASGANFYTEALMNRCQNPGDHSPVFTNMPIKILCVSQDFIFKNSMYDSNLSSTGAMIDSFTYEWAEPLSALNSPIGYTGSYTNDKAVYFWGFPNAALPFPRGIHLDPQTGDISFRPMKAEVTVMVVKVNEFRNGTKIAELRREFEIIVITCTTNNPPTISTLGGTSKNGCAGDTFTFKFSTGDADSTDTITIKYDNAIPGATWSDSNGLSMHPSGMLTWITNDSLASSLPYTFIITATDNGCPLSRNYVQVCQIRVKSKPSAYIIVTDSGCGNYWFRAQPIIGTSPVYSWQGLDFSSKFGSVTSSKLNYGLHPYSMTMSAGGCGTTYYDTVLVKDTFITNSLGNDTTVCLGSNITLTSVVKFNSGKVKMTWGTGKNIYTSDTTLTKTITVNGDIDIWSAATDSTGCKATDTIQIKIHQPIGLNLGPDVRICSYGQADIMAGYQINDGAVSSITWTDLKTNKVVDTDSMLNTTDSGRYTCRLIDTFGCTEFDTVRVVKSPEVIASAIGQIICYGDEAVLEADITGGGNAIYLWYEGTKLIGASRKITVKPSVTTDYLLKVTETISGLTCIGFMMVRVKVNPLPGIKIYPIDKRCINGPIISLNNFVRVDGIYRPGGIWSSTSAGLIYGDKFNPLAAGVSSPPGWKVIYEYTDPSTGCYNKDSDYVTVYALPKPFAGFDEDVCTGSKKALNGLPSQPAGTWRGTGVGGGHPDWWFNPDTAGIINGSSYKLIFQYTDINKCMNEDTVTYTVNAKPATPVINVSTSDSFLECVLANGLYKWFYRPDLYTSPTMISYGRRIDPKLYCKNCYFGVTLTDSNGCVSDTSVWYYFSLNSINTNNKLSGFKIYPNPANKQLFIENTVYKPADLAITDIYGRLVARLNLHTGKNTIDISSLKPGIYVLRFNGNQQYRLVVE